MRNKLLIGFGILAIIAVLVAGGFVLLNVNLNALRTGGGIYGTGPMVDPERTSMAAQMGISREELDARLEAGEHITEIAASLGFTETELEEIHARARDEAMAQLLADGTITEEQAAKMREQAVRK
jgi:hypothetical protein